MRADDELPNSQSASLFNQGAYENLAAGVEEPKIEHLVQIGGAASKFGKSVAQVADITSSTASEQELSAATRQLALTAGEISKAAGGASLGGAAAVNFITVHFSRAVSEAVPRTRPSGCRASGPQGEGRPRRRLRFNKSGLVAGVFSAATSARSDAGSDTRFCRPTNTHSERSRARR
jgi:hypothetical protein